MCETPCKFDPEKYGGPGEGACDRNRQQYLCTGRPTRWSMIGSILPPPSLLLPLPASLLLFFLSPPLIGNYNEREKKKKKGRGEREGKGEGGRWEGEGEGERGRGEAEGEGEGWKREGGVSDFSIL